MASLIFVQISEKLLQWLQILLITEDCIDSIGPAVLINKLNLLKGYWQVLHLEPFSIFLQYTVMAVGMKSAPATLQSMMHVVLGDVLHCNVYLDDVIVYSDTWAYLNLAKRDSGKIVT